MPLPPKTGGSDPNLFLSVDAPDYLHHETITTRQKRKRQEEDLTNTVANQLKSFKEEMMAMLKDWRAEDELKQIKWDLTLTEIKTTTQELEKSVSFLSSQIDGHAEKITGIEQQTTTQDETISTLKSEVENLRRESRKTFLEIRNIPFETSETRITLSNCVTALCKSVDSDITPAEIKDIYRISGKSGKNKPVVVEFTTQEKKQSILKAAKNYNTKNKDSKLNTSHLGLQGSSPIFLSDYLTPFANRLYFLARDLVKTKLYKYCWTVNGKIYVKKTDDSPGILISSEAQIHQLKTA